MQTEGTHHSLPRRAYSATRSFLRFWGTPKKSFDPKPFNGLKVAFIHSDTKIKTGAHKINELMSRALEERGVRVRNFFPRRQLTDTPVHLKGIANILFFHSLLEHKDNILKNHIIQGTTYTPLPFVSFEVPVVCHFGSTIRGYLDAVPATKHLPKGHQRIFKELVELDILPEFDLKTLRPMEDVADIEVVTASRATACIATSEKVKHELVGMGIAEEKVHVIHNAIEDYWFEPSRTNVVQAPHLVFLGRLGGDVFTLKLKGFSHLVNFYRAFPDIPKTTICLITNSKLKDWLRVAFPKHYMFVNLRNDLIPGALAPLYGSILFLCSMYEGFSLSLIEGMSQGLVPITYSVGVVPEIIKDGENGYIVSTLEEACARTKELLSDDQKRLTMAEAAKATARQFRSKNIAGQLLTLYHSLREMRKKQYSSKVEK